MKVTYKIKLILVWLILAVFSFLLLVDCIYKGNFTSLEFCSVVGILFCVFLLFYVFIIPIWKLEEIIGRDLRITLHDIVDKITFLDQKITQFTPIVNNQRSVVKDKDIWLKNIGQSIEKTIRLINDSRSQMYKSSKITDEGKDVLNNLRNAMNGIKGGANSLEEIMGVIRDINKKTKIINEIVFETKLLSFNASIEAARAGQYGKGFAIVAQEIGNLALMSGKAALGISSLLESSTSQVRELITYIQGKIKEGENATEDCRRVFGWIAEGSSLNAITVEGVVSLIKEQQVEMERMEGNLKRIDILVEESGGNFYEITDVVKQFERNINKLNCPLFEISSFFYGNDDYVMEEGSFFDEAEKSGGEGSDEVDGVNKNIGMGSSFNTANVIAETKKITKALGTRRDDDDDRGDGGGAAGSGVGGSELGGGGKNLDHKEGYKEGYNELAGDGVENRMDEIVNNGDIPNERAKDIAQLYNKSLSKDEVQTNGTPAADDERFINKS
ncbi:MAG: hypothetical protein HQK53_06425 [Oligoflexia bacterium]|nr:hypothetical protein [Oligoflexia bacterium]